MEYGFVLILLMVLMLGFAGGMIANFNDRSFWLGAAIGVFLNIPGLLILTYIGKGGKPRSFNPDFESRAHSQAEQINQLNKLYEQGKLTDEEFEQLKNEIINSHS